MTLRDRPWALRRGAITLTTPAAGTVAEAFHRSMPGFVETPLVAVPQLAERWGVTGVHVKDESHRLGLPAFKILGASWAVNRTIADRLDRPPAGTLAELRSLAASLPRTSGDTRTALVTATDGNHGRALAHMARLLGLDSRIYVPGGLPPQTLQAIRSEDATVIDTGVNYDEAVAIAAASTRTPGSADSDLLIQDTAWDGYHQVPEWIIEGYSTMFAEIDRQFAHRPRLVVVPTGVGSLLQAALQHYRAVASDLGSEVGSDAALDALSGTPSGTPSSATSGTASGTPSSTRILAVEPVTAACVTASLAAGRPVTVDTSRPTTMAGLNCGTVSATAWPLIRDGLDAAIGVDDDESACAMGYLAALPASGDRRDGRRDGDGVGPRLAVGACGAAAPAGVEALRSIDGAWSALGLDATAHIVLISTDGPAHADGTAQRETRASVDGPTTDGAIA